MSAKMEEACAAITDVTDAPLVNKQSSNNLLGYAAKDLQQFDKAKQAFEWVASNSPQNAALQAHAKENADLCEAMAISLLMG